MQSQSAGGRREQEGVLNVKTRDWGGGGIDQRTKTAERSSVGFRSVCPTQQAESFMYTLSSSNMLEYRNPSPKSLSVSEGLMSRKHPKNVDLFI